MEETVVRKLVTKYKRSKRDAGLFGELGARESGILPRAFGRIVIANHAEHLPSLGKQVRDDYHLKQSGESGKNDPGFLLGIEARGGRDGCCCS
jgi:hypothetical protein